MPEKTVADPVLLARLQLSIKGVEWAAGLLKDRQHEAPGDAWTAHQHLWHLVDIERNVMQVRVNGMLDQDAPVFPDYDEGVAMNEKYAKDADITELAQQLIDERQTTVDRFKTLTPEEWARTGTWPQAEVDVAWAASRMLSHSLEHFADLLVIHQSLDYRHSDAWKA